MNETTNGSIDSYDVKAAGLFHSTFNHLDDFIFHRNIAEERQSLSSLLSNMSLYFLQLAFLRWEIVDDYFEFILRKTIGNASTYSARGSSDQRSSEDRHVVLKQDDWEEPPRYR